MTKKKVSVRCATCGGGPAHHRLEPQCWCPDCLKKPEASRCTEYVAPTEERPAVTRNVARVGHAHPATAHAAAGRALPRTGSLRASVLKFIQMKDGCTDDELEQYLGRSHQSVSAVRNSLMNDGWIEDSGTRRATRYGNDAIVWRWIPENS